MGPLGDIGFNVFRQAVTALARGFHYRNPEDIGNAAANAVSVNIVAQNTLSPREAEYNPNVPIQNAAQNARDALQYAREALENAHTMPLTPERKSLMIANVQAFVALARHAQSSAADVPLDEGAVPNNETGTILHDTVRNIDINVQETQRIATEILRSIPTQVVVQASQQQPTQAPLVALPATPTVQASLNQITNQLANISNRIQQIANTTPVSLPRGPNEGAPVTDLAMINERRRQMHLDPLNELPAWAIGGQVRSYMGQIVSRPDNQYRG